MELRLQHAHAYSWVPAVCQSFRGWQVVHHLCLVSPCIMMPNLTGPL
jgi:hypothetical protein